MFWSCPFRIQNKEKTWWVKYKIISHNYIYVHITFMCKCDNMFITHYARKLSPEEDSNFGQKKFTRYFYFTFSKCPFSFSYPWNRTIHTAKLIEGKFMSIVYRIFFTCKDVFLVNCCNDMTFIYYHYTA